METALNVALILTNVINDALLPSPVSSLSECLHTCFYSTKCATFFYDRVKNKCYQSQELCSTPSQQLTARNDVNCYEWNHAACPENWSYHKPTDKCLHLQTKGWTQTDAQSNCNNKGGRLVNIYNSIENRIVRNIMKIFGKGIWIGLKKTSGTWKWNSGVSLSQFKSWSPQNPGSEKCATMSILTNKWFTYSCGNTRRGLCELVIDDDPMYCLI